jgi:hypothetical protein
MIILFCHFRAPIPKHLVLNIQRTISLFPDRKVCLLTDLNSESIQIENLNIEIYKPSKDWIELESLLGHPKKFRNNFWFTSLSRFIAISEFAMEINSEILHLESDVIISKDFPFQKFENCPYSFQFPIVSDSLAIASILYIKNSQAARYLAETVMCTSRRDGKTTDMHILRAISNDPLVKFRLLPSAPSDTDVIVKSDLKFLSLNSEALNFFNGIFDGFDIGRYLFGIDPRNGRGFSKVRYPDNSVYVNARKLIFSMDSKRDFPYIQDSISKIKYPIFSLHIHSKNNKFFKLRTSAKMIEFAVNDSLKDPKSKFYPNIFLRSVLLSIKRRLKDSFEK